MTVRTGGKLSSVLAAFESTIKENERHGGGLTPNGSFLSSIASTSSRSASDSSRSEDRGRRHTFNSKDLLKSSLAIQNLDDCDCDENDDKVNYTVRWSPQKRNTQVKVSRRPHTVASAPKSTTTAPYGLAAPPFCDESHNNNTNNNGNDSTCYNSESTFSESESSYAESETSSNNTKKKKTKRIIRRIVRIKKNKKDQQQQQQQQEINNDNTSPQKTIKRESSLKDYSSKNNKSLSSDPCSPTEASTENSSLDSPVKRPNRRSKTIIINNNHNSPASTTNKSPTKLGKISATLQHEASKSRVVNIAQNAVTTISNNNNNNNTNKKSIPQSPRSQLRKTVSEGSGTPNRHQRKSVFRPNINTNTDNDNNNNNDEITTSDHLNLVNLSTPRNKNKKNLNDTSSIIDDETVLTNQTPDQPIGGATPTTYCKKVYRKSPRPSHAQISKLPIADDGESPSLHTSWPPPSSGSQSDNPRDVIVQSPTFDINVVDLEYEDTTTTTTTPKQKKKVRHPLSPMPHKSIIAEQLQKLDIDDSEGIDDIDIDDDIDDESAKIIHNANSKTITVVPAMKRSFPSDASLCTLDPSHKPIPCSRRPSGNMIDLLAATDSPIRRPIKQFSSIRILPRSQVQGILRTGKRERNTTRRVLFADQQPGGGRRMSMESSVSSSKDSMPMRPRRARANELNHRNAGQRNVVTDIASTRIQAAFRGWRQWKSTRLALLQAKMARIEKQRVDALREIQNEKWRQIENIQKGIIEKEKRLASQITLGEKLVDHLKKDSASIEDQTKRLKTFSQRLKNNNENLDKSVRLQCDNFVTMSSAVELLQEKSDRLLKKSNKLAKRVHLMESKVEESRVSAQVEFQEQQCFEKAIRKILRLVHKKCDDENLLEVLFNIAGDDYRDIARRTVSMESIPPHQEDAIHAFDLRLKGHSNDDMSVFSDLTEHPGQNTSIKDVRRRSSADIDPITEVDEDDYYNDDDDDDEDYNDDDDDDDSYQESLDAYGASDVGEKASLSREDSFAMYNASKLQPRRVIRSGGNSFADYTPTSKGPCKSDFDASHDIGAIFEDDDESE